jgi:hypothetical protein
MYQQKITVMEAMQEGVWGSRIMEYAGFALKDYTTSRSVDFRGCLRRVEGLS